MSKLKTGIARILSQRPQVKYIPVFMTGMGKSLPKGETIILPYNATIHFGTPTLARSTNSYEIMEQIENDFEKLKSQYELKEYDEEE